MTWRDLLPAFTSIIALAAYFAGIDAVAGWQGFGKGLAIGALTTLSLSIGRVLGRYEQRRRHITSA